MPVIHSRRPRPRGAVVFIVVAVVASILAGWLLSRRPGEADGARRRFAALQQQVALARDSRAARQTDRGRVMRLRAQARAASGAERDAFEAEASGIEARLAWGDRGTVRSAVLSQALIPLLTRFTGGPRATATGTGTIASARQTGGNGCLGCHLAIDVPGYESYPAPFRTHPRLSSYVGASSPHPPSRVRCESCHQGDGYATTFAGAGHATLRAADAGATSHAWHDPNADGAMLPVGRIEASCVTCHAGERDQPGAPALNEALTTIERGGCYACHDVPGMERTPKRGPDLRRIGSKLTEDWVRAWLSDPRAIKPATWMPRFWGETPSSDDRAAIDAVVGYLFDRSEPFAVAVGNPPRGEAGRGKTIVESVGCLGCHVVGSASRDETGLRRTFGQPLEGIGAKTTYAWLVDWLRDPPHFSPSTRMPSLRLSAAEAADVAAYLASLTIVVPSRTAETETVSDQQYRDVIARYAPAAGDQNRADVATQSGRPLLVEAGRTVISALGCFNCHEIVGFEGRRTTVPMRTRPVWTDAAARAVHSSVAANAQASTAARADFGWGTNEATRLALALTTIAGRPRETHALSTPWHLAKVAGRTLAQERNCVGCHQIDGTGGDFVKLVAEPSLGPPLLTPEGSRVKPEWLRRFLRQPSTIRPWLSVRMPTFALSDEEIEVVGAYFVQIAPPNPTPRPAAPGVTPAAGRELFELLKCQQCHVLGTIPADQPAANLAPDLRMAPERLQPDWILAWLRDPSAILPGTRMPTFWPDYPKSFYPQVGGDGAAQVRAIRDHLLTLH